MYLICGWNSMVNRHDSTIFFIERPLNLPIFTFNSVKRKSCLNPCAKLQKKSRQHDPVDMHMSQLKKNGRLRLSKVMHFNSLYICHLKEEINAIKDF